jgi:surface polysaccharide O-acyltransferase-like enzyme
MARSQYAAYVFHMPVVVLLQAAVLSLDLPPLAKFFLVTAAAVPATFLLSDWIRRPAFVRRVL